MRGPLRWLLAGAGLLSMGLGLIGVFVPLLPTTPFLLLASVCFLRSSKTLHRRLMTHRILGPYLQGYLQHRAISRRIRRNSLYMLWGALALSAFVVSGVWVRLALGAVGIGVSLHLMSLRTMERDELIRLTTEASLRS